MPASAKLAATASRRRPAARRSRHGTGPPAARGEVPALRLARHARARALRLDVVQGALRVPRLPRAVRPLQGALMAARNLGSTRTRPLPGPDRARMPPSPRRSCVSTVGGESRRAPQAPARALPPARGRRGAPAHRRRGRGHLRGARGAAGEYDYLPGQYVALRADVDGHELRRSYSICRPPVARAASRVAIKRDLGGRFSTWAHERARAGRRARRDEPAGHVHLDARRARRQARRRHRRRLGHHAAHGARRTRCSPHPRPREFTLVYTNRVDARRDVPRGARRPEGPLPRAARAAPRALARAAHGPAALGPHRRREARRRSSTC